MDAAPEGSLPTFGPPPGNDFCAGAIPLVLNAPVGGTNADAVNDYQLTGSACFTGIGQVASTAPGREVLYAFTAPVGNTYSFRAQNQVPGGDLVIYVASSCPAPAGGPVNVAGCLGASNRNPLTGAFTASEEVSCLPLAAGQQVFVYVDEAAPTATGGAFTLEVTTCPRELEPNDSPLSAAPPLCGIEGSLSPLADVDFYFPGPGIPGGRLFALADQASGNTTDIKMRVTTSADTLEFDNDDNATPWGALSPNIAGTPLTGVPVFIKIDRGAAPVPSEPYRLYEVLQPPQALAAPESEPNNTVFDANVSMKMYFTGSLPPPSPSADVDMFRFCADTGDLIYLSIDGDPLRDNTPLNASLALFDSSGTPLFASDDPGSTSSTVPGTGTLAALTPFSPGEAGIWRARYSGAYYARVATAAAVPAGAGDYLLSLAINCLNGSQLAADLAVTKTTSADPIVAGQVLTYTLAVTSAGPNAAMGVVLSDATPANTTFESLAAPLGWTCTAPPVGGTGAIVCASDCLGAGVPANFAIAVRVGACIGDGVALQNAASVTSQTNDPDGANNLATRTVTVVDLRTCDDGNACTTDDRCQGVVCVGGPPPDCTDCNACTDEVCDPANGCVYTGVCNATLITAPLEVPSLSVLANKTTFTWTSMGGGALYDLLRGLVSGLPVGPGGGDEICVGNDLLSATTTDGAIPAAGAAFWYLVRGQDGCGPGIYGHRSNGAFQISTTCL